METLVLTQGYVPHGVVDWRKAITLVFDQKVEVVHEYDDEIRSPSIVVKRPAVVRLLRAVRSVRGALRLSRSNVLARDRFACQYCGAQLPSRELTLDHVLPRSRGGRTSWDNLVAACVPCNQRKAARTPSEACMTLRTTPVRPTTTRVLGARVALSGSIPPAWAGWVA